MAQNIKPTPAIVRVKTKHLLASAATALSAPLALVAGFKDSKSFKAQLIKSLGVHPEFDKAAHDLHALHMQTSALKAPKGSEKSLAGIRPSGRIQATRNEMGPSKNGKR